MTAIIAIVFAGVTLKDIPLVPIISRANPEYLQSALLSIYIACWAIGTTIDTKVQHSVYFIDRRGDQVGLGPWIAVAAIAVFAIIVLIARRDELWFALALAAFTSVDILTWAYLRFRYLPPIIRATKENYLNRPKPDYYRAARLDIVVASIIGDWKWRRQLFLFTIVLLMITVALSLQGADMLCSWFDSRFQVRVGSTRRLLPDALLFLFIAVSELWIFAIRLKAAISVRVLKDLQAKYDISLR